MLAVLSTLIINTLAVLIGIALTIIAYFKWSFTYWSSRNVPHKTPSIPFGNSQNPIKRKTPLAFEIAAYYKAMKPTGCQYAGYYLLSTPQLIPINPELIKNILLRQFSHFSNRGVYYNEKDDPLTAHLFTLEDEKWRKLRAKLSPTFTSGKMKMMFETVVNCAKPMVEKLENFCDNSQPVDIKEIVACFTTDVIGSCAFGIECNSFKYPDAEFRKNGKAIFSAGSNTTQRVIIRTVTSAFPELCRKFGIKYLNPDVAGFFKETVRRTLAFREENNVSRKDFIQLLIDLSTTDDGLTLNEMSAQAFLFFVAGFETSSSTMAYCLYELSKNMKMQDKLRKEIETVLLKHQGDITYDGLMEMKYLVQVLNETLRKYPPVPIIPRICTKTYHDAESNITIEEGMKVLLPVYALHHDPEYFPNPEKFDPERFSEENKDSLTPFTYLPFGDGPRICIGNRFGMMQMKLGIVTILNKFKVELNKKSPEELLHINSTLLTVKDPVYLDLIKLKP